MYTIQSFARELELKVACFQFHSTGFRHKAQTKQRHDTEMSILHNCESDFLSVLNSPAAVSPLNQTIIHPAKYFLLSLLRYLGSEHPSAL